MAVLFQNRIIYLLSILLFGIRKRTKNQPEVEKCKLTIAEIHAHISDLVSTYTNEYRNSEQTIGNVNGRSGSHGIIKKRVGTRLIQEANRLANDDPCLLYTSPSPRD